MNCGLRMAGCGVLTLGLLFATGAAVTDAQESSEGKGAATGRTSGKPDPGLQLMSQACAVQCHSLKPIALQKRDVQGWRRNILLMVSRGAQVLPEEIDPLAAQLARAGQGAGAADAAAVPVLPEGRGRAVLVGACLSTCHTVESVTERRNTRAGWNDVVGRMKRSGVVIGGADEALLLDYLTTNFGVK